MDLQQLLLPLLIAFAVALIGAIAFVIYETKKQKKKKTTFIKTAKRDNKNLNRIYLQSYNKLIKFRVTRSIMLRIRKKVETLAVYDDMDVRREVMRLFYRGIAIIVFVILLLIVLRPGWLITFWVFVGILFLTGLLTDQFVSKTEMKLLNQLKYYNGRLRHYYQQTKMVDESAYEAIADVGPEMKVQATKIYNILMSTDPEEEQAKYEETAPSRFLKVVSGLMVLVKDKGDKIDSERGSAFTRGIGAVNEELNAEIIYRNKLAFRMRFLAGIALSPIFFALPIKDSLVNMFPVLQKFYESRTGLIAAVIIYTSAVAVYLLIRKIKEVGETQYRATATKTRWEKWVLEKVPFVDTIMRAIGPKYNTRKYAKRYQLLKDANSAPAVTWLTLRQTTLFILTVITLVVVLLIGHHREEQSTLYTILPDNLMSGNLNEDEQEAYRKQTEFDRNFIEDLQSRPSISEEEIKVELAAYFGVDEITDTKVTTAYKRIMKKYDIVENAYLKWWEFLVILLIAYVVWLIPIALLHFQRSMRWKDMENEVHQFLTIISILKEFDNITVFNLLTWLERFSITFKAPLQVAIQNFDSGADTALAKLAEDNNFDAFKQLIERMQLALVRLSVQEAYEDIEIEREFYQEQRKEFNERSIGTRVSIGNIVTFIPAGLLLICYFVGPVLYMSITEMIGLMNSL